MDSSVKINFILTEYPFCIDLANRYLGEDSDTDLRDGRLYKDTDLTVNPIMA